jgi:GNAT superfamily N-acetyltransferase
LKFKVTRATSADLAILVAHRLNMWKDIHPEQKAQVVRSESRTRSWIRRKLAEGSLVGLIARAPDGTVAGSGCIWLRDEQPRPTNPGHVVPYLMSMYTEKGFRRRGVARLVVKSALKWCRDHGYERVTLHASTQGRPLYESLGFETTSEMRLSL